MTTLELIESTATRNRALARKAKELGIEVFTLYRSTMYFARSERCPDELFAVTLVSCECPMFITTGCCLHHAALLEHTGQLDPYPTPPPPAGRLQLVPTFQEAAS